MALPIPQITEAAMLNETTGVNAYASGLQNAPDTTLMSVVKGIDAGISLFKNANEAFDIDGSQAAAAETEALKAKTQQDLVEAQIAKTKQQTELEALDAAKIKQQEQLKAAFQEALIRTQSGDPRSDSDMVNLALQAGAILDPAQAQMIQQTALRATNNPSAVGQLSRGLKNTATRAQKEEQALGKNTFSEALVLTNTANRAQDIAGFELADTADGKKQLNVIGLDNKVIKSTPLTSRQTEAFAKGLPLANQNLDTWLQEAGMGTRQERGQNMLNGINEQIGKLTTKAKTVGETLSASGVDWTNNPIKMEYQSKLEDLAQRRGELTGEYEPISIEPSPGSVDMRNVESAKAVAPSVNPNDLATNLGAVFAKGQKEVTISVGNVSSSVPTYEQYLSSKGQSSIDFPASAYQTLIAEHMEKMAKEKAIPFGFSDNPFRMN